MKITFTSTEVAAMMANQLKAQGFNIDPKAKVSVAFHNTRAKDDEDYAELDVALDLGIDTSSAAPSETKEEKVTEEAPKKSRRGRKPKVTEPEPEPEEEETVDSTDSEEENVADEEPEQEESEETESEESEEESEDEPEDAPPVARSGRRGRGRGSRNVFKDKQ